MTQIPDISQFLHGAGGGGKGGAKNDKNTLRSNATVRFVALLSDGEIVGPTRGSRDIILDETRLQADNGQMNFQGVQWDFRPGLPDQTPFPNFKGVEQETTVGVEVTKNNPVTRTLTDPDFTHCRVTIRIPALFKQSDDGMKRTSVQFRIEVRPYNGAYVDPFGVITLSGKNTSGYDKSYLIELPQAVAPNVSFPWEIRVTRITPDAEDNTKTQDMVYFASLTGIIDEQFTYPDSALLAMAISAEDFEQGLPTLSVEGDGAIIKVPTNYDPVSRTYNGIWNGTFKEAYTDNPAWIYYDIVTNKRVGMGNYISESSVDKWSLYEIAAYCDQLVPDGFGGMEPRFRMAAYLTENKECYELLQLIASAFRGMSFWSSGSVTAVQDRPSDPEQIVTRANVVDGEFVYSSSSHTARHTVAHVRYMDPNDLYKSAVEVVRDPQAILRYGERVKEVNAFGCTSRGQARRLGMWILQSELYETQTVTYRAGMDHASLKPGSDILIMDERISGVDNGGRLKQFNSLSNVTLDREVELKSGVSYSLYVMMPDGSVASSPVTGGAGTRSTLTLGTPLPQQPVSAAVWVLSASDVAPRPFRVLANTEKDDHIFEITALQKHVPKYEFVDHSAKFDAPSYREERELTPPSNLRAKEYSYFTNGVPKVGITVSWEGDPKNLASIFRVEIESPNDQDRFVYPRVSGYSVDIEDVLPGVYTIRVYTLGLSNGRSDPATLMFDARGWGEVAVPEIRNLRLARPFTTPDCEIMWENFFPGGPTNNSMYKANTVKVYGLVNGVLTLRREETVFEQKYTYTIDKNRQDGTAARRLVFHVTATYVVANIEVTSTEAELTAYNEPIPAPAIKVDNGIGQILISWEDAGAPDYVKSKIWVQKESGFDPHTTETVYEGNVGLFPYFAPDTDPRYIRVAHIDTFSETDFLASSEVIGKALEITLDLDPPATPTGLALSSEVLEDDPGFVQLIATWDANQEEDLAGYDIQLKERNGNFVSFLTSENEYKWRMRPAIPVTVQIAAYDKAGNKSVFSAPVEYTTATDDVPPAVPANVKARGGIDTIWLEWSRNTEPDLAYYQVYETGDDAVTEPPAGEVTYTTVANSLPIVGYEGTTTRYFWVRAVDTSGNVSPWSAKVTGKTGTLPDLDVDVINYVGITFKPGEGVAGNTLTWTAGQAIYGTEPTVKEIGAGQVEWVSGRVFVYYVKGATAFSTTTNLPTVYSDGGEIVGVYRGGLDFQLAGAEAYMNGELILARTIGADQLAVDHAVITGSAQIAEAIIGDAHVNELSAAKLKAGTAMANSITVDGRTLGTISNGEVAQDDMTTGRWQRVGGVGSFTFAPDVLAQTGTNVLTIENDADQHCLLMSDDLIPFDPQKLYRVSFRVRKASGANGQFALGFIGIGADKKTLVNAVGGPAYGNQHLVVATWRSSDTLSTTEWTTLTGFVKGQSNPATLNTNKIAAPAKLHPDVRFVRPMIQFNNTNPSTGGKYLVDLFLMESVDENAAEVVNAGTTRIEPGKILIAGETTLADWRSGGDLTEINGGKLSANSVHANSLVIGQRGVDIINLEFEHNKPSLNSVSWTSGTIAYIGDDGNSAWRDVVAGNAAYTTGTLYVYWVKGATQLSTTTSLPVAQAADCVILATYQGDNRLVAQYGRTVIDGNQIKTGTIRAEQADIENFRSNILVANVIKSPMIEGGAITADKMAIGAGGNWLSNSDLSQGMAGWTYWTPNGAAYDPMYVRNDVWTPPTGALDLHQKDASATDAVVVPCDKNGAARFYPVTPGQRIQVSAYLAAHRCKAGLYVEFYDANGTSLSAAGSGMLTVGTGGNYSLSGFTRVHAFGVAPTNATKCRIVLSKGATLAGNSDSYFWATRMFLGEAGKNQTEPSLWSDSTPTVINGGNIATKSITANEISVQNLSSLSATIGYFQTAASGQRTIITDAMVRVFDWNNVERVRLGVW